MIKTEIEQWNQSPHIELFEGDYKKFFLNDLPDLNESIHKGDADLLMACVKTLGGDFKEPLRILEIGTWKGGSAAVMIVAAGRDVEMFCVDTWQGNAGEWNFEIAKNYDVGFMFLKNMTLLGFMDRVHMIRCESHQAVKLFKDKDFHMIFIDGDHRYEGVKQDIEDWWSKLKVNGIMAGHDMNVDYWDKPEEIDANIKEVTINQYHPGVTKAVYEMFGRGYYTRRKDEGTVWYVTKGA